MNLSVNYQFNSLEDYLTSRPLDVDGMLDDGWGAVFPVKGREIEAAILFIDIAGFSRRTYDLSPTETLIFVNNFFSWITAEGLRGKPGIVDKYIGDEMMLVFSEDFGSEDPLGDALVTARWMAERDVLAFCPHIGISMGQVVVGYVGTPLKYSCSVFGRPVSVASRCCGIPSEHAKSIFLPAEIWGKKNLNDYFKPRIVKHPKQGEIECEVPWEVAPPRRVQLKNLPDLDVVEIHSNLMHMPMCGADDRAKLAFEGLKKEGSYRPRRYPFEPQYKKLNREAEVKSSDGNTPN
ncbi:MAG: adenylate/guanylate cyclase domain-containing protein [Chthoniobacterales bacterium]|nr:adenylate/guanylate cyclase domain-containing protein [Chthoniobacterales bacterium]